MLSKTKSKYYYNGAKITEEKYNEILQIIKNKPAAPEGYDYRLNDSLEWEQYEIEACGEEDLSAEEALAIITEGVL